jgi:hypothetical protein
MYYSVIICAIFVESKWVYVVNMWKHFSHKLATRRCEIVIDYIHSLCTSHLFYWTTGMIKMCCFNFGTMGWFSVTISSFGALDCISVNDLFYFSDVSISFELETIIDLDQITETLKTASYMVIEWNDTYLQWNRTEYNNLYLTFWPQVTYLSYCLSLLVSCTRGLFRYKYHLAHSNVSLIDITEKHILYSPPRNIQCFSFAIEDNFIEF